jgi:hypothetical protein
MIDLERSLKPHQTEMKNWTVVGVLAKSRKGPDDILHMTGYPAAVSADAAVAQVTYDWLLRNKDYEVVVICAVFEGIHHDVYFKDDDDG